MYPEHKLFGPTPATLKVIPETFADDNYALRQTYARVSGDRPGGVALLTRTRHRVEKDLARALAVTVASD